MLINSSFNKLANKPDLFQTINSATNKAAQDFNAVKIGIIEEFYPENLTAKVKLASKKLVGLNVDGSQVLRDYPPIFAKLCYCTPFATFPLTAGMECVLLFSDREIETWYINGGQNSEKYPRMHDITDAIAIVGIRSLPMMIQIISDCFNFFYGQSNIKLFSENAQVNSPDIDINGTNTIDLNANTININGTLIINGQPYTAHTHTNGNNGAPTGGVIQ